MLDFAAAQIENMALHWVGNKSKEENMAISQGLHRLDENLEKALRKYFFKPFKEKDEFFKFQHHSGNLELNEMYSFCKSIFSHENTLYLRSVNILQHLYDQSTHAKVKSGEVYIVHISGCIFDGQEVEAVGIFKSEDKDTYLKFNRNASDVTLFTEEGVNIKQLDKGCIVFNSDEDDGYRVLSVDRSNYDAIYWMEDFLNIEPSKEENFQTQNYIALCRDFSNDVVAVQEDKKEQVMFLKKSVDFFGKNEEFDMNTFMGEVVEDPEYIDQFKEYKKTFEEEQGFEIQDDFVISKPAVRTMKKYIKNLIKLDTNIEIKLNFNDAESAERFIVKGYDEDREMYFYQVYFNQEIE